MPPRRKVATGPTPVEDLRHEDTRANIPTGELAGFVADEQDSADLEVPSVPIYVQEKVIPARSSRTCGGAVRARTTSPACATISTGWTSATRSTSTRTRPTGPTRMILGDSLLAMTSLAERRFAWPWRRDLPRPDDKRRCP